MNVLAIVLFFIAAFHFCLYYCNMDVFTWAKGRDSGSESGTETGSLKDKDKDKELLALSESKEILEKHLKELKQYNTHG